MSHQPAGMLVVCAFSRTPVIGGVILRGLCHANVHVDDVFLVSGSFSLEHENIPFCGANTLTPEEFMSGVSLA